MVLINKINNYTLKKLDKILKIDVTKNVCVCNELIRNKEFIEYLKKRDLKIVDGRWLFKFMLLDILEFVSKKIKIPIETMNISILTKENSFLVSKSVERLSSRLKNINIITNKKEQFKSLEKKLYEEKGLIITVTNNLKKGTLKSNVIFNLDFEQSEFSQIIFPKDSVIVNLGQENYITQKSFNGINSNFFSINLPQKYRKIYKKLNNFDSVNLYESFIYKKTPIDNIWREIEEDKIEILDLEGKNGRVKFKDLNRNNFRSENLIKTR